MKITPFNKVVFALFAIICMPTLSYAHTGLGTLSGLGDGFSHPLSGADHVTAMIAVGIWAFQSGGKSVWAIPTSFVAMMFIGGILGYFGINLPFVEHGILLSILVFGILIAASAQFPLIASILVTGAFAIFHGHSHGTEIPPTASGLFYSLGFIISTAALHLTGIAAASATSWQESEKILLRFAGAAIASIAIVLYF